MPPGFSSVIVESGDKEKNPKNDLQTPKNVQNSSRASDTCHGPRTDDVPEGKIDDCADAPSVITLSLNPPREVLGYEFWDNEADTWHKSNQLVII